MATGKVKLFQLTAIIIGLTACSLIAQNDIVPDAPCLMPYPPLPKEEEIFKVVEKMPVLQECAALASEDERRNCTRQEISESFHEYFRYPASALEHEVEGTIVLRATVNKDGSVAAINIIRDINGYFEEEAVRTARFLFDEYLVWAPGKQRGRPVNVQIGLPIKISLPAWFYPDDTPNENEKREAKQHTENDNDKPEATASSGIGPSGTPLKKEAVGFRLFPNPANEVLTAEYQAEAGPLVLRIFTPSGQLAKEQQLKVDGGLFRTDIELAQMTPGVYFLNITQAGRHYSKAFSIQWRK